MSPACAGTNSEEESVPDQPTDLLIRRAGAVLVISFNRPKVLNAMRLPMATAYADTLRSADADPEVRAVVVTGEGRGFCSGADLAQLTQGPDAIRHFMATREDLPTVAFRIRKPVICAVNGAVAGVGFAYMMGSDIRFAAADARLSTTFARLGLVRSSPRWRTDIGVDQGKQHQPITM